MPNKIANGAVLRRLWRYLAKRLPLLFLSLLLAVVANLLMLYIPLVIGDAIDHIIAEHQVDFAAIIPLLLQVLTCTAIVALATFFMNLINNRLSFSIVQSLRNEAFDKLQTLPLSYIDSHPHGDTVSRLVADADQLTEGLLMGFTQLFSGLVTIVGTLVFMLTVHPLIALVVVLATPLSLLVARFIARRTYRMFSEQSAIRGEQTAYINEMVTHQRVVRAFSREDACQETFDDINKRLEESSLKAVFFSSLVNPSTRFVNGLVYAGVGLCGALTALAGGITIGGLSCFLTYANQYTKPFNEISGVIAELQNALACAKRVFDLLDTPSQPNDPTDNLVLQDANGVVTLQNVSFSYVKERPLLQNISLDVTTGQRIAIVGPTGCGKTTLINLLMRFYEVDDGAITVDGTDVRDITRHSLRQQYGMVLQETWLKTATVRENIALGCPDAAEEEIIAAAKAAHAHTFISRLPQGYDTVIGDEEENLSAGQRQLLCIARIMLRRPPMLILDEATSSIDTRTEQKIQQAFALLMEGKTSFIVAHRLSTIRSADCILVMKDGNVIEQGNHDSLMQQDGFYKTLYNSQFAP